MKHPRPWRVSSFGTIFDANDEPVAGLYTPDPEARAVLLHAAEMFAALKAIWNATIADLDVAVDAGGEIIEKIEAEIAKGKP